MRDVLHMRVSLAVLLIDDFTMRRYLWKAGESRWSSGRDSGYLPI